MLAQTAEQVTLRFVEGLASKGIDIPDIRYDYGEVMVMFDKNFRIDTSFIDNVHIQDGTIVIRNLATNDCESFDRPQLANYE